MKIDWTPVSERLPEEKGHYMITVDFMGDPHVVFDYFINGKWHIWNKDEVLAWAEKPEPWKGEE